MRINVLALVERRWKFLTAALAALVGSNLWLQYRFQRYDSFLTFVLGFAVLTVLLPLMVKTLRYASVTQLPSLVCGISRLSSEEATSWLADRMRPYLSNAGALTAGVALLAAGLISTGVFGIPWDGAIRSYFYVWLTAFLIGYGIVGWLYFGLMALVAELATLEVNSSVFSWPRDGIQRVYFTYFRLFLVGAMLYIAAVVTVWISPGGAWIAQNTGIGRLWVFPPGAMVIIFFLHFHYQTHLLLAQCKRKGEGKLTALLSENLEKWSSFPSAEVEGTINSLLRWRKELREEGTWLLDFKSVLVTVATLLLPTIKAVIDLL